MGVLKKVAGRTGARSDQKISLNPLTLGQTQISLLRLRKKPGIASGCEDHKMLGRRRMNAAGELYSRALLLVKSCSLSLVNFLCN